MSLINAPHLKEQRGSAFEDLIVLIGEEAWKAWDKGKAQEWLFLCENVLRQSPVLKPVILGDKQLADLNQIRIANEEQKFIKLFQFGALSQEKITALCLNLAKNTKADIVELCDSIGQQVENLSGFVQRLRNGESVVEIIDKNTLPKLKEKDGTNIKARAFVKWLNLDIAQHRLDKELYCYTGISWETIIKSELEMKAVQFYDEQEFTYSARSIDSMIETVKIQAPKMGEQAKELLAFKNGVLNRATLEFSPHCRENWLTAYIPHNYDEQATRTPHFDRWLNFVSDGNEDKARNILAALYAILTNRYNWQMFFEITGKGGSGKSVFASIATLLAGDKNAISAKLEDFDNAKDLEGFENKTLILCPEQSKYVGDGGGLKSISGGDLLRVNPKHKKPFFTKITALIMLINNEPCRFTERAGGVERRRVIFDFKKSVPEKERDPHFMDKITLEVGGIIRKVLDAFPEPADAKKALNAQMNSQEALEVKKLSDPLTAFFEYFYTTEQINGLFIGVANMGIDRIRTHLYPAYLAYTRAMNISELGLNNFVIGIEQALKQHGNEHGFIKRHTKTGRRTNIHFKDFDIFRNDISI